MQKQKLIKKERRELQRLKKTTEKQTTRRVVLWTAVFLGISGIIFGMIKFSSSDPVESKITASLARSIADNDQIKGNEESEVILIEYSDFQCPACGNYYPLLKQLNQEFGSKVQFIYRHFPLKRIHQNADLAARAGEAAGNQNKFWEMHDLIFENQREWSDQKNAEDYFIKYARSLNLDVEKFKSDLTSEKVKEKVEKDYESGIKSGVNATPTFFLNGEKIQNPRSYDSFKNIINKALQQNSG